MSIIGVMAATEKLIPLGHLHMRPIQLHPKSNWQAPMSLGTNIPMSQEYDHHLKWWTNQAKLTQGNFLQPLMVQLEVFTDGLGAHCGDKTNL